jgi:hypothetical protein
MSLLSQEMMPLWFESKLDKEIVMYVSGKNELEAKEKTIKKLENIFDNDISFNDLEVLKKEILKTKTYLKIKYMNQDIIQAVSKKTNNFDLDIVYLTQENKYLIGTKLFTKLKKISNHYPKITFEGQYAYYQGQKIFINQKDFNDLLLSSEDISIKLNIDDNITRNKNYFLSVENKKDTYISILQVFSMSNIEIVLSNEKMTVNKHTIVPNFKDSDGLIVNIDERINKDKFMTIILSCEEKLKFDNPIQFSSLIHYANTCDFTSKISNIIK